MVNILASFYFIRVDLTQEKIYTLNSKTKELLKTLPNEVLVKVYLHGDLPLSFKKFSQTIREQLDEFRVYAGKKLQYEFIDPYENNNPKQIEAFITQLYQAGLQPTNVKMKDAKGGYSEKMIIPGAIVSFGNRDFAVNLLNNNPAFTGEENINYSIQNLEYNLINAIRCITNTQVEKIAFLEGHGEWDEYHTGDIMKALSNYFQIDRGQIHGNVKALDPYKCIIIAGPTSPLSEEDKFVIDQYIMKGGKVVWLIDAVSINRDSFVAGNTFAVPAQLNIDDMLFKYGIRINPVLIQDVQCAIIPIATNKMSNQPNFTPMPWLYFPLLIGNHNHPVSRNLNLIRTEFVNYIDTLHVNNINFTVLLQSSKNARLKNVPSFISLSEVKQQLSLTDFNSSNLPIAVLAEGIFPSVFQNRILTTLQIKGEYSFMPFSKPNKMIVIADGDIIRNNIRVTPRGILITPLGFDSYTSQTFGNKDFLLNAIQYLTDEKNIIELRSRNFALRLLDKTKIMENKLRWQLINTLLPVFLVLCGGLFVFIIRKYLYVK